MTKKHWHSMNGSIGCLPDNNEIHATKRDAIDYLVDLFPETKGLKSALRKYEIYYSQNDDKPDYQTHSLLGADYCEIFSCFDDCESEE